MIDYCWCYIVWFICNLIWSTLRFQSLWIMSDNNSKVLLNHIIFLSWTTCRSFERHLWTFSSFRKLCNEAIFVIILFFYLLISADFLVCQLVFQVPDTRAKHCIPLMFFLYTKVSYLSNPVYNFSLPLRDWSWFSVWTTPLQGHGKFITWHNS